VVVSVRGEGWFAAIFRINPDACIELDGYYCMQLFMQINDGWIDKPRCGALPVRTS
jgi:hypothetical protein